MAPWVLAGLTSPWSILGLVIVVIVLTGILYVVARNSFRQFGLYRLAAGYLGTLTFMIPVSAYVGSFEWKESVAAFMFLAYVSCLALAIVVVPAVFALAARGRASAPWAIMVSVATGVLFTVGGHLLRGPGIGEVNEQRLLYDFLSVVILLAIVGIGFSLGTKLPWRTVQRV
jgi:hypothetical protein